MKSKSKWQSSQLSTLGTPSNSNRAPETELPSDSSLGSPSEVIQTPGALKNEDILKLIFEHFDFQPGSKTAIQTRKDLLSAAKTCKAFLEPALNSLWRVIPSLLPLLLLLPSAKIRMGRYIVDELPDPFSQQSSDWERFDVHARRVKSIYMEPLKVIISPTIYLGIRAVRDSPPLPGLNQIYIPDNFPFHLSPDLSSALFLASVSTFNLVQLDGNAISEPPFFIPFLSSLHAKSPQLTHLVLRGVVNMSSLEHVHRFTNLQSLEIEVSGPYWHPPLLQQLGQLRDLLELTISTGTSKETPATMQPHAKYPSATYSNFGKLRKLHIRGNAISTSRILNEMRNLSNLITLMIEGMCDDTVDTDDTVDDTDDTVDDTDNSWTRSFEVISTYSAVEHIEINLYRKGGYNKYPLLVSWLSPLFKLDNLKNLIINGAASALSGSDDDFRLLARAFLKLKKFIVPPTTHNLIGRTLACLYHFSRECADLREIKICISFDIFENLNAIKMLPHPLVRNHRHPLEKLYINSDFGRKLEPSHLVRIARFLDLIFPNLSTLETDDSNTTEAETWAGIHEFRLALQDARIDASRAIYLC